MVGQYLSLYSLLVQPSISHCSAQMRCLSCCRGNGMSLAVMGKRQKVQLSWSLIQIASAHHACVACSLYHSQCFRRSPEPCCDPSYNVHWSHKDSQGNCLYLHADLRCMFRHTYGGKDLCIQCLQHVLLYLPPSIAVQILQYSCIEGQ